MARMGKSYKIPRTSSPEAVERIPSGFDWPEELAALLGKISDAGLAKKAGVCLNTVRVERHRRGLEPFNSQRSPIEWTPEKVALLGTQTDAEVAQLLGIHASSVCYARHVRGIPAFRQYLGSPRSFPWTAEDLAMLGKLSDHEVAKTLGLSPSTVARKRRILGIPPFVPRPATLELPEEGLSLLGQLSDAEVAQRYGYTKEQITNKRKDLGIPPLSYRRVARTPELAELLRLPTTEAMRRTGLKGETIAKIRRELGIKAARIWEGRWSPSILDRLGKEPDAAIARDTGFTVAAVKSRRQALSIPAFRPKRRWQPEDLALLNTSAPDHEIAERLGRSLEAVRLQRNKLKREGRA
jgi:hypothetical protein